MNETKKYKLLTAIRYLGDAFFYPFFSLYLQSTGLIEDRIGFILSISPILSIICNPFYSFLCKDINKTKNVLAIITIIEAIVILTIPFASNFYIITFLTIFLAISGSCHYGMLDSISSFYANKENINYSSIRIYGSIAYIIATTLGGYFIKFFGYKITFAFAATLFIASGVIYHLLMPLTRNSNNENNEKISIKEILLTLLKNKKYLFFVLFYMLLMGTQTTTDAFFSLYLSSRGVSSSEYGIVYSYFVSFEVITLFIINKKKKSSLNKNFSCFILLAAASLLLTIRMFINYLNLNIYIVEGFSALRGIAYAFILHTAFQYVQSIVPEKCASTAIMLQTFVYSIYVAVFNNINGNIIKNYSYKTFYFISLMIALFTLFISIIRIIIFKKENLQNEN